MKITIETTPTDITITRIKDGVVNTTTIKRNTDYTIEIDIPEPFGEEELYSGNIDIVDVVTGGIQYL